jgi:deoxyguanosine kinase
VTPAQVLPPGLSILLWKAVIPLATPYIAVEGPIGVGKTTLARAISEAFHFELIEEIVEGHPFLKAFYEDMERTSFQTEMFFLIDRFEQLENVARLLANGRPVVSDYHIAKNQLFAAQTLKKRHLEKFNAVFSLLTDDLPKPNIVIYLKARLDTLLERIQKRGRPEEAHLTVDYLKRIVRAYEEWVPRFAAENPSVQVLTIETDDWDIVGDAQTRENFLHKLNTLINEAF